MSKVDFIRKAAMDMYIHNNMNTDDCIKYAEIMANKLEAKGYGWKTVEWPNPTYHPGPGNVLLCNQHTTGIESVPCVTAQSQPSKRYEVEVQISPTGETEWVR